MVVSKPLCYLSAIRCFACETSHNPRQLLSVCTACGMPLRVDYDLSRVRLTLATVRRRTPSLWRYRELLPVGEEAEQTLAEGFTPLLPVESNVWVKDEARNPTGSFKARGMSVAVSMAKQLGARELAVASEGNAATALAAYGSRSGLPVTVVVPEDTPAPFVAECEFYGATVHRVEGTLTEATRFLHQRGPKNAFELAPLREPYRVEGKKTLAYELVEQMDGEVPDVIVYPTGNGIGLIGMWKAFDEMERLGWIARGRRPRFVAVQAEKCAPIVKAFERGSDSTERWPKPRTKLYGLQVPAPIGGFICLRALRDTDGTAMTVTDAEAQRAAQTLASSTGIDVCPEGGAAWAAVMTLRESGFIGEDDSVVVLNTATGQRYR